MNVTIETKDSEKPTDNTNRYNPTRWKNIPEGYRPDFIFLDKNVREILLGDTITYNRRIRGWTQFYRSAGNYVKEVTPGRIEEITATVIGFGCLVSQRRGWHFKGFRNQMLKYIVVKCQDNSTFRIYRYDKIVDVTAEQRNLELAEIVLRDSKRNDDAFDVGL